MTSITYEYEPYLAQDGAEIPCFRIYEDGEEIAETNENLSAKQQEDTALLFTASVKFLSGLQRTIAALNKAPAFQTDEGISSYQLISEMEELTAELKNKINL